MKMSLVLFLTVLASCNGFLRRQTPEEQQLNSEFAAEDSFGNTKLEPPCSKIECGEYECSPPFESKTNNTCCGYCWAPDHKVAVDRHTAVGYNSTGFAVDQCDSAPSTCTGPGANAVRCFKPSCREGEEPHCAPGACCHKCVPAR